METKHTPGPWISNDLGLQNVKGDGIAAYAADCWPNDDDARLIAAAPDLLSAARFALNYLEDHANETSEGDYDAEYAASCDAAVVRLRAAIAKAEAV